MSNRCDVSVGYEVLLVCGVGNSPSCNAVTKFMDTQGSAHGTNSPGNFPDSYLLLLNGLSADKKLLLAERLIESVRSPAPEKSIDSFYGAWVSDKSAEEMIEEIEGSRTSTDVQREEFIPEKSAEELIADLRNARSFTRDREEL